MDFALTTKLHSNFDSMGRLCTKEAEIQGCCSSEWNALADYKEGLLSSCLYPRLWVVKSHKLGKKKATGVTKMIRGLLLSSCIKALRDTIWPLLQKWRQPACDGPGIMKEARIFVGNIWTNCMAGTKFDKLLNARYFHQVWRKSQAEQTTQKCFSLFLFQFTWFIMVYIAFT